MDTSCYQSQIPLAAISFTYIETGHLCIFALVAGFHAKWLVPTAVHQSNEVNVAMTSRGWGSQQPLMSAHVTALPC
jgi:hypothetical protein